MASRGSGRTGGSNGSSGHNSKPYARPESSSKRSLRQQDRSLLGGLFSRAKSLFSLGSSAPPELQPPAATQTESNGSMPAPQVPHRLAGTYTLAGSSSRVPARTSARGTTPIAMLQISPEKANNPFKNDTEGLQNGTLHGLSRQQSPFRSPSLTALRLRSPSPERAQSPQRPGSVILNSRGSSPYRRPLERPGSPANASTLISDRRLQRDSSLISNQSHRSGIVRSASIASFADHTPRKRQMLWDPQHGFVAASTERDPSQELQPSNEAERILSQLESMSGLPHRQRAKSPVSCLSYRVTGFLQFFSSLSEVSL